MPVSGLILRPYQPSDFEALLAMDQVCFPKAIAYGRREMKSYLQSEGSHCIVAEIPGRAISGPAISGTIAGFILTERAGDLAHIITLDVLNTFRRMSSLTRFLYDLERESALRGGKRMVLETATTNKAAIALWKKHGYRETATLEHYYGRGQNAFEMQKRVERKSQGKVLP